MPAAPERLLAPAQLQSAQPRLVVVPVVLNYGSEKLIEVTLQPEANESSRLDLASGHGTRVTRYTAELTARDILQKLFADGRLKDLVSGMGTEESEIVARQVDDAKGGCVKEDQLDARWSQLNMMVEAVGVNTIIAIGEEDGKRDHSSRDMELVGRTRIQFELVETRRFFADAESDGADEEMADSTSDRMDADQAAGRSDDPMDSDGSIGSIGLEDEWTVRVGKISKGPGFYGGPGERWTVNWSDAVPPLQSHWPPHLHIFTSGAKQFSNLSNSMSRMVARAILWEFRGKTSVEIPPVEQVLTLRRIFGLSTSSTPAVQKGRDVACDRWLYQLAVALAHELMDDNAPFLRDRPRSIGHLEQPGALLDVLVDFIGHPLSEGGLGGDHHAVSWLWPPDGIKYTEDGLVLRDDSRRPVHMPCNTFSETLSRHVYIGPPHRRANPENPKSLSCENFVGGRLLIGDSKYALTLLSAIGRVGVWVSDMEHVEGGGLLPRVLHRILPFDEDGTRTVNEFTCAECRMKGGSIVPRRDLLDDFTVVKLARVGAVAKIVAKAGFPELGPIALDAIAHAVNHLLFGEIELEMIRDVEENAHVRAHNRVVANSLWWMLWKLGVSKVVPAAEQERAFKLEKALAAKKECVGVGVVRL